MKQFGGEHPSLHLNLGGKDRQHPQRPRDEILVLGRQSTLSRGLGQPGSKRRSRPPDLVLAQPRDELVLPTPYGGAFRRQIPDRPAPHALVLARRVKSLLPERCLEHGQTDA
jgi:hypothetical protein